MHAPTVVIHIPNVIAIVVVLVLKDKFKVLVLVLGAQVFLLVLILDTQVLVLEEKSLFLVFFSWHLQSFL